MVRNYRPNSSSEMLLHESEKLQMMGFSVCLVGVVLAVSAGLPWARVMFALSLFLQGVSQSAVLIAYGEEERRGSALSMEKHGMAAHMITIAYAFGLVLAAAGLIALAFGF